MSAYGPLMSVKTPRRSVFAGAGAAQASPTDKLSKIIQVQILDTLMAVAGDHGPMDKAHQPLLPVHAATGKTEITIRRCSRGDPEVLRLELSDHSRIVAAFAGPHVHEATRMCQKQ